MSSEQKYFNFPIKMLQGVLDGSKDKVSFLTDLLYYHIESHAMKMEGLNEYEESETQRFKRSAEFWGVTVGDNPEKQKKAEQLLIENETSKVFVGINTTVFWSFYKEEKTDLEWECLVAFLALKSILGNKSYSKSNNALLYSRMSGLESANDGYELSFTEYHRNKIIFKLETEWELKYYSRYTRGFYFGIDVSLKDLIFQAESKRESLRKESLKNNKAEILKRWQKSQNNDAKK